MTEVYDAPTPSKASARNGRRSRRISSDLWVRVGGIEAALRLRKVDLCATGIYLATRDAIGSPGDVVMLSLASQDQTVSAKTLARISRVVRQDDRARGARVIGAAFEFLPLDKLQSDVTALLHTVAACELRNYGLIRFEDSISAQVRSDEVKIHCELRSLGFEQLTLSSPTPLPLEARLTVAVASEVATPPLRGSVVNISREAFAGPDRYGLLVRLDRHSDEEADQYTRLVRQLLVPESLRQRRGAYYDFCGQISRLPMDEILSLLKREQYSGVLSAGWGQEFFSFGVKNGEIVECECAEGLAQEEALARVLNFKEGDFKFRSRRPTQLEALARPTARLMHDVLNIGSHS